MHAFTGGTRSGVLRRKFLERNTESIVFGVCPLETSGIGSTLGCEAEVILCSSPVLRSRNGPHWDVLGVMPFFLAPVAVGLNGRIVLSTFEGEAIARVRVGGDPRLVWQRFSFGQGVPGASAWVRAVGGMEIPKGWIRRGRWSV